MRTGRPFRNSALSVSVAGERTIAWSYTVVIAVPMPLLHTGIRLGLVQMNWKEKERALTWNGRIELC